ncbi:MAG: oligosaccharide flippase family protein, partial [Cyclobacteriaceae bacterium]
MFKIFKSKTFKNVFIVASGAASAQILGLIFSPIIARLYGPDALGKLGIFLSVYGLVSVFSTFTLEQALVLIQNKIIKVRLLHSLLFIISFTSFILLVIFGIFSNQIADKFNLSDIKKFLVLIPFFFFFSGLVLVFNQIQISEKMFKANARITIVQSIFQNSVKSFSGLISPSGIVLIAITISAKIVESLQFFNSLKNIGYSINFNSILKFRSRSNLYNSIKDYIDFPKYRAPQTLFFNLSQNIPILLLGYFFGPISAGYYSLSKKIIKLPAILISKSIGDVLYPKFAEIKHKGGNLKDGLTKATLYLFLVGSVPYGFLFFFGVELFSFVYGDEWLRAGEYSRWISLWLYSGFCMKPTMTAIPV